LTYRIGFIACLVALGWSSLGFAQPAPPPASPAPVAPVPEDGPLPAPPSELAEPAAEAPADDAAVEGNAVEGNAVEANAGAPSAESGTSVEQASAEAATQSAPEPDIYVTGSRIKSTFGGSAGAFEKIDHEQLARSGATNLPDVIASLSASQGSGPQGSFGIGAAGGAAASINLRGLGPAATLLLLNNRRLTPSGSPAVIGLNDLSVIPLAAVERIEILKAGAAAIYGADAVAGVVNIITRRNWEGMRVELNGQSTSRFDHDEYTASVSFGSGSERSRVMAAASYFRRSELTANERDFPADKYVIANNSSFATFVPVGMPDGPQMADPGCPPDMLLPVFAPAAMGMPMQMPTQIGSTCRYPYRQYISWLPNVERANAFASAEYDLSDHLAAFGELVVSRYRGDNTVTPSFSFNFPNPIVPADHVDNPFGVPLRYQGRPLGAEYGAALAPAGEDNFRGVVGLTGDLGSVAQDSFFESWQWELSASFGISRFRQTNDDNLRDAFQSALNACSDPSNLSNCFNPFASALDGTGTPNSERVIRSFTGRQALLADHALQTYNAGITGSLLELPGGDVGLAFGGEIRHEWRVTEFDHDANLQRYGFVAGNDNSAAERSVYSGYLELRWPFLRGLELQTAVRVERYTDTETTPSPFAALTFSPAELIGRENTPGLLQRLQIRANVSRAFRVPTILDTYPGVATVPLIVTRAMPRPPVYVAVQSSGNPELVPEKATTLSAGLTWSPIDALNLTADYWFYDYTDRIQAQNASRILQAHDASVDMGGPADPAVVLDPATGEPAAIRVHPINVSDTSVTTSGIDFGLTLKLDGADFGGAEDDFGVISLGVQGSFTLNYYLPRREVALTAVATDSCDQAAAMPSPLDRCNVAGKRNAPAGALSTPALPRIKANIPLNWSASGHSISVIGHYVSGFDDESTPTMADVVRSGGDTWIPAWLSFDLQYGYTLSDVVGKELSARVGVLNLFDKMPPTVFGNLTPYEGEVHDPRGRMFYAKLDGEF
jgi:iron complex outermembrane recepter protein